MALTPSVAEVKREAVAEGREEVREKRRWRTDKLLSRLGVDALSAGCAGVLVAPIITVIDRGIIENASGRATLKSSVRDSVRRLLFSPSAFVFSKPFGLVFMLYSSTYLSANLLDTTLYTTNRIPPSPSAKSAGSSLVSEQPPLTSTTSGPLKFGVTSVTNLSLCLLKDRYFARVFSPAVSHPIPKITYACFTTRDCLTIFASFNLPPLIAPWFPATWSEIGRLNGAQFLAPAAMQVLSTPCHLLGLDLYNRPGRTVGWMERMRKVRRDWGVSCAARVVRILPAFGVGGVVNSAVRRWGMGGLEREM